MDNNTINSSKKGKLKKMIKTRFNKENLIQQMSLKKKTNVFLESVEYKT